MLALGPKEEWEAAYNRFLQEDAEREYERREEYWDWTEKEDRESEHDQHL